MTSLPASHLAWQVIDDEAIIVDLSTGNSIGLNATATFVWSRLADNDVATIARELAAEYSIEEGAALNDVLSLVRELTSRRLLGTTAAGTPA
jgi:hypothetical protein